MLVDAVPRRDYARNAQRRRCRPSRPPYQKIDVVKVAGPRRSRPNKRTAHPPQPPGYLSPITAVRPTTISPPAHPCPAGRRICEHVRVIFIGINGSVVAMLPTRSYAVNGQCHSCHSERWLRRCQTTQLGSTTELGSYAGRPGPSEYFHLTQCKRIGDGLRIYLEPRHAAAAWQ
jgi:hypothetical protein